MDQRPSGPLFSDEVERYLAEQISRPFPRMSFSFTHPLNARKPLTRRQRFAQWRGRQWWKLHDLMFGQHEDC